MISTFDPRGFSEGFINLREILLFSFGPLSPILCSPFAHCSCTFSITSSFWTWACTCRPMFSLSRSFPLTRFTSSPPYSSGGEGPDQTRPDLLPDRSRWAIMQSRANWKWWLMSCDPHRDVRELVPGSHSSAALTPGLCHWYNTPRLTSHPPNLLHDLSPWLPEAAWLQGWNSTEG